MTAQSERSSRGGRRNTPTRKNTSSKPRSKSTSGSLPASLSDLSSQIWDHAQVKSYLIETVEEILKARNVPKHRVTSPNLEITIPAVEAMRYSTLRREIAGLIASTMDLENASDAHPSFLNILSQLTRDEMNILAVFPGKGRVLPVANLWVTYSAKNTEILHRNIVPSSIARLCDVKSRIPTYVDNLLRLQLLQEPDGIRIEDNRLYTNLTRQTFCSRLLDDAHTRRNSKLEKRAMAISGIGETLVRVCSSPTLSK